MRLHDPWACVWHEMQRPSWRNFDPILLAVSILLVGYGLLVIASATRVVDVFASPALIRQATIGVFGVVVMIGLSFVDYRAIGQIAPVLYLFMMVTLVLVQLAGTLVAGAQRWLDVAGVLIQPSELAKLISVICLARFFAGRTIEPTPNEVRANPATGTFAEHIRTNLVALAIVAPAVVFVYLQPDLGTSLVLISIYFSVAYFAGAPYAILGGLASVPLLGFPVVWQVMKPYMRRRITSFLSPDRDPLGEGYNLIQARISVGSGGWWGRGLGNGTQTQLNFLRVQHTDFIFAVIGEELGFMGGLGLLMLYGILFWRCLRAVQVSRDAFGRYLVGGITGMILFQAFVNIAMNIGLLPVTGIPLPFISLGGSSLLTLFASLGLVQSVVVHSQSRRYDAKPSVEVPARSRLRAGRFALPFLPDADVGFPAVSRYDRMAEPIAGREETVRARPAVGSRRLPAPVGGGGTGGRVQAVSMIGNSAVADAVQVPQSGGRISG